ncbi:glycosyltransferase family 2 protein [Pseudomonadota bacterium]
MVNNSKHRIAVVVPCYRVRDSIVQVVKDGLDYADAVYCVDDACPQESGRLVASEFNDDRVKVIYAEQNGGVGSAMKAGYKAALDDGFDIMVKLDGDGQMDASLIPFFTAPIEQGDADYCKGNRFHELEYLEGMPAIRLFGNSVLSLLTKVSSGYWKLLDPTNGYTAIHASVLKLLPFEKLHNRYFFESDMLFRLNIVRAVVRDIPMRAHYGDETSSLQIHYQLLPFFFGHIKNFFKRTFYTYFLRDFNIATLQLLAGLAFGLFGLIFGISAWSQSIESGVEASAGTVMLAGMPTIIAVQLLLSFLNYDIQNVPANPLSSTLLPDRRD